MLHDPDIYPDPMVFNPDRFNGDDDKMERVKDLVFGFGPRFCPGRFFNGETFFSIVATTLATCDILPGLDKDGNEVLPNTNAFTPGTVT
jgi:cytochrome P450